ncbi:MAG: ribose 5-phosphate isomerase A, partial [Betaproteobacteria bacterium TMED156]
GADEIDEMHCMTKGGGGALTLEKIVAEISSTFICLVDETKLVQSLGKFPIPIEVISEAVNPIIQKIKTKYGGDAIVRKNFLTDHGNQILDLHNLTINNPVSLEKNLNSIPGVVTNGIFAIRKANMVLVGTNSGLKILKSSGFD